VLPRAHHQSIPDFLSAVCRVLLDLSHPNLAQRIRYIAHHYCHDPCALPPSLYVAGISPTPNRGPHTNPLPMTDVLDRRVAPWKLHILS